MSEIMRHVGRKLRSYRQNRGMTQEELAEKADLHYTYIGQVERGEKNLTLVSLEKILDALEISFEELFAHVGMQYEQAETDFAALCYDLISEKTQDTQEKLYHILCEIEKLMQ